MARYLDIVAGTSTTITINYPTRAEFRLRKEYFQDFVLGGDRFGSVMGLTRFRPEVTLEYEPIGFRLANYAIQQTMPLFNVRVNIDGNNISVGGAQIDSWEITCEEGRGAVARVTFIGTVQSSDAPSPGTIDYSKTVPTTSNSQVSISGTPLNKVNRWSVRINNNCQPLYYGSTVPATIQPQNCEITGRIRVLEFKAPSEGNITITTPVGNINLYDVKFEEVPPSARGWEVPETEISFRAGSISFTGTISD
jgi:hypothetical protein